MNVNANNPIHTSLSGNIRSENVKLPFVEGERLNVTVLKMMANRTIVQLSRPSQTAQSITMTLPQILQSGKVYSAKIVGGRPVILETLRENVAGVKPHPIIEMVFGGENEESGQGLMSMLGGIFGLNNSNRINNEETRRNCLSFSDEHGNYYFIFRLPVYDMLSKFVIRLDSQLNTVINVYAPFGDESYRQKLTSKMRMIQSALGQLAQTVNFAIFTDYDTFASECEAQLGLNGIDLLG